MKVNFLNARHWQLFSLMYLMPVLFIFWITGQNTDSAYNSLEKVVTILFSLINLFILFGWIWQLTQTFGKNHFSASSLFRFHILFIFSLVYLTLFTAAFSDILNRPSNDLKKIVIPLHLLSLIGLLYSIYFGAKSIKSEEKKKEGKIYRGVIRLFLNLIVSNRSLVITT